jgi:hypothetical protein
VQLAPAAAAAAAAASISDYAEQLVRRLSDAGTSALLDAGPSVAPGAKFHTWERRGVPLRLEVGAAEVTAGTVTIAVNPGLVVRLLVGLLAQTNSSSSSSSVLWYVLELYAHGWQQQAQLLQHTAAAAAAAAAAHNQQATPSPDYHPGVHIPAAAGAASCGTAGNPWGGNAVAAAGVSPLKLAAVPAAKAAAVCKQLLQAMLEAVMPSADVSEQHQATPGCQIKQQQQQQQQQQWTSLLPFGCCSKLHLWPDVAAADRPCLHHLQFLVGAVARQCHCGAGRHVSLQELQGELQHQLQEVHGGNLSSTIKFTAGCSASAKQSGGRNMTTGPSAGGSEAAAACSSSSSTGTASLFVSRLPTNRPAAAVRQQLLQQLSGRGVLAATVPAVGQGRRCRGWAKLLLADESSAAALLQQTDGQLVSLLACVAVHHLRFQAGVAVNSTSQNMGAVN